MTNRKVIRRAVKNLIKSIPKVEVGNSKAAALEKRYAKTADNEGVFELKMANKYKKRNYGLSAEYRFDAQEAFDWEKMRLDRCKRIKGRKL